MLIRSSRVVVVFWFCPFCPFRPDLVNLVNLDMLFFLVSDPIRRQWTKLEITAYMHAQKSGSPHIGLPLCVIESLLISQTSTREEPRKQQLLLFLKARSLFCNRNENLLHNSPCILFAPKANA